jgi:protein-L-isoaspartate(D-aspartate) O-methyltransferase
MRTAEASRQLIEALRERGIADDRVLAAMSRVPREAFVDPAHTDFAYEDQALPIDCGQTISQPYVVAYMTEKLAIGPDDEVLEIGTGSGYQAAVLAKLAHRVFTVERHEALLGEALKRFRNLHLGNITAIVGDGAQGWPEAAPYDAINVAAAADEEIPAPLLEQLGPGGRLIAPVERGDQHLVLCRRRDGDVERTRLERVRFVPLT